ncbi:recombinase family protein [Enteractinococcus helveticum]|uniref:Resolvase n=1 Tax=Enteractinococcus helveticum TaxID=1837282 RepID=A0A1B7M2C7_9MICC|nr:recombinase family protein [Enteractinococcus helveticum]OAV62752.1 resolvase [Enteractinococcus helveticum]
MVGQIVGYLRINTVDQDPAPQLEQLRTCQKIFQDTGSGKSREARAGLHNVIQYVRHGDVVMVPSMDRLGHDTLDLYRILDELTRKGATVKLLSEGFTISRDDTQPTQQLLLQFLAVIADLERAKIKERQVESIALAKAKGKYTQQPKLNETDLEQIHILLEQGTSKTEIARQFQVSRQTVYNTLNRNQT